MPTVVRPGDGIIGLEMSDRRIDLLLVSIGGNDIGFARLVANAVLGDRTMLRRLGGWFGQVFQPIFDQLRREPNDTLLSDLVNTEIPEWGRTLTDNELHAEMMADTFVGGSPWTGFANLAFSTGSASIFLPNDATLGGALGAMVTDNVYVIGGITNAFSDPTDPFDDSFDPAAALQLAFARNLFTARDTETPSC